MKKLNITREFLEENYLKQEKSSSKIAKELNCNYMTVLHKLKEFGIPARKDGIKYSHLTKEFLEKEYLINQKGTTVIANESNCSQSVIMRRLRKYKIIRREPDKLKDISGNYYGEWFVLDRNIEENKWRCRCSCGKIFNVSSRNLISSNSRRCQYCCRKLYIGAKHSSWKGYKEITGTIWSSIKESAKKRGLKLNITKKYVYNLYLKQNKKCTLTGLSIEFSKTASDHFAGLTTASLDRIDSKKGYIKGNVQWSHKEINKFKSSYEQTRFIELCKLVASHNQ